MMIGSISCDMHGVITASYFYLLYPGLIFLFSLIVYLFTWLLNRHNSLKVAIVLSILNIVVNMILFLDIVR
jgi:hypothetical protein